MYKLILRKLKEVSEYDALELLEINTYRGQRMFKPKHFKMLRNEISGGHFLVGDVATATLEYEDKRKVLVNGQHQLKAVMETGIPITVVYQEYSCATPGDLSDLYSRFDNHQARSLGDILRPEADALGVTWKHTIIRLVVSAASFIHGQAYRSDPHSSKIDKVKLLSAYLRQGAFVDFMLKDGISCFHMQRAPIIAAMMSTWDKDKVAAKEFWEMVRDGVGLSKDSPALRLRNYLLTTGLTKCRTTKTDIATGREMYVKCIHAWNAHRSGTTTTLSYHEDAPEPKIK